VRAAAPPGERGASGDGLDQEQRGYDLRGTRVSRFVARGGTTQEGT